MPRGSGFRTGTIYTDDAVKETLKEAVQYEPWKLSGNYFLAS